MPKKSSTEPDTIQVHAQVARVKFETAHITFTAKAGEDEAKLRAIAEEYARAHEQGIDWNAADCQDGSYQPFAVTVMTDDDIRATDYGPGLAEAKKACDNFEDYRFLLLQADVASGEGDLVEQPWFITDPPDLMTADLAKDWIAELTNLGVVEMSERADELFCGAKVTESDRTMFRHLVKQDRRLKIDKLPD